MDSSKQMTSVSRHFSSGLHRPWARASSSKEAECCVLCSQNSKAGQQQQSSPTQPCPAPSLSSAMCVVWVCLLRIRCQHLNSHYSPAASYILQPNERNQLPLSLFFFLKISTIKGLDFIKYSDKCSHMFPLCSKLVKIRSKRGYSFQCSSVALLYFLGTTENKERRTQCFENNYILTNTQS